MPYIREGLCATDQRKCARMLADEVNPKVVAAKLRTSVEYVKKFTQEALDNNDARNKDVVKRVEKHLQETRKTAAAIAGAANEILNQGPKPGEFE